jgi:hypothetical protein
MICPSYETLNNIGIFFIKLDNKDVLPILNEVNKIKNDFSIAEKNNKELAGNLEYEFVLTESKNYIEELLIPILNAYDGIVKISKDCDIFTSKKDSIYKFELDRYWVNFQKKYEFNPPHTHSGLFSFVLWLKMPFNIKDEMESASSINSNNNTPAHFNLFYINSMGRISVNSIPVDETYENVMCIFPAKMMHSVNPFYTSDDFRISVAGNFSMSVKDKN